MKNHFGDRFGLWGNLVKEKYFKGLYPSYWLTVGPRKYSLGSTIRKSLIKRIHVISKDLSWKVGRRFQMFLGIDLICGIGEKSLLSLNMIQELQS